MTAVNPGDVSPGSTAVVPISAGGPERWNVAPKTEIDTTRAARISYPMLTTRYGGPIAIAAQSQELIPDDPRFRVRVELESAPSSMRETRGELLIEGRRRSPLGEALTNLLAIVIRESGF